ncbi:MAG: Holliday junction resolvase RuvX [Acidobacteriota bacterium]
MRVVGIDFGNRRIGIAVSDATGTLARPVLTLDVRGDAAHAVALVGDAIVTLERDDEPVGAIVVGLPRRLDGSANAQTPIVEAFAARLRQQSGRTVVLQDERLTSHQADQLLAVRERDWRVRKQKLDAAAAAVILQEYLDARPPSPSATAAQEGGNPEPGPPLSRG